VVGAAEEGVEDDPGEHGGGDEVGAHEPSPPGPGTPAGTSTPASSSSVSGPYGTRISPPSRHRRLMARSTTAPHTVIDPYTTMVVRLHQIQPASVTASSTRISR